MDEGEIVALATYPFDFKGRIGEYFRIWIVSLCLSVATLGLFDPRNDLLTSFSRLR